MTCQFLPCWVRSLMNFSFSSFCHWFYALILLPNSVGWFTGPVMMSTSGHSSEIGGVDLGSGAGFLTVSGLTSGFTALTETFDLTD